jgi:aspartate/methionine/tyrosine aminotransferase
MHSWREAIAKHDFQDAGVAVSPEEIFISDGSNVIQGIFRNCLLLLSG